MIRVAIFVIGLLIFLGISFVYVVSEWKLNRSFDAPLAALRDKPKPDLKEGERMAKIVGCLEGCHGPEGEGGYEEIEGIFRNTAPTLSQVLPLYTDEELVRLIRYGLKRNGKSALGMISYTFWALSDEDLFNIITHLRTKKATTAVERKLRITWRGRLSIITGKWKVSVEQVDRSRTRWGDFPRNTLFEKGRYLASITCTECHGLDFEGNPLERAPTLKIIGAYSLPQFMHLMRTAKPIGDRELDENMQWVAYAPFKDEEIHALYEFLRAYHGYKP